MRAGRGGAAGAGRGEGRGRGGVIGMQGGVSGRRRNGGESGGSRGEKAYFQGHKHPNQRRRVAPLVLARS